MSSIFNDPEWEQQRKEILTNWARRDGEVKVDMGETEEYMPAEEFLALRQKYPNGNMRLSEPQEAMKVFKDKGLPLPAELSFVGSVKPIFGQEDAYNGSSSFPAETFNFPASANEGYQSGLVFSPIVSAMQMPEGSEEIKAQMTPSKRAWKAFIDLFPRGFDEAGEMISQDIFGNAMAVYNLPLTLKDMASSLYTMGKLYYELPKSMNDKEKHFIISCVMAKKSPMMSTIAGYGKEVADHWKGTNTLKESHEDLDADRAGRLYGINNPYESCYVGAKKYRESLKK